MGLLQNRNLQQAQLYANFRYRQRIKPGLWKAFHNPGVLTQALPFWQGLQSEYLSILCRLYCLYVGCAFSQFFICFIHRFLQ